MRAVNESINKVREYIIIAVLDLLIISAFAIACEIFPFGKYTSLMWDADGQYINFMAYLQSFLKGESHEALYSLNIGMGNGTIALLSYYLLSPFNLLVVFFSREQLPIAVWIIQILKLLSISCTMLFYLQSKSCDRYLRIIFALAYAFSGYSIAMLQNFMFLDAVLLLPVIAYYVDNIKRNYVKLFLAVWILIISNFYIGYSTCIFTCMYYLYNRALISTSKQTSIKKEIDEFIPFIITMISSALASSVILIPVVYELGKNRLRDLGQNNISIKDAIFFVLAIVIVIGINVAYRKCILNGKLKISRKTKATIAIISLLSVAVLWKACCYLENLGAFRRRNLVLPLKFFVGSYNISELVHGLPNVYITVFVVIVIILYSSSVGKRIRLINISFVAILLLCMTFRISNYVWSGFTEVSGSPYRYSFCFIFVLLKIAAEYSDSGEITLPRIGKILLLLGITGIAVYLYRKNEFDFLTKNSVLITIVAIIVYLIMLTNRSISDKKRYVICLLFVCVEICFNVVLSLSVFDKADYETYLEFCNITQKEKEIINNDSVTNAVFRTESDILGKSGWPYIAGNNSVVHYSSVMPIATVSFLDNYGMAAGEYMRNLATTFRSDADPRLLAFLGIRYLLTSETIDGYSLLDSSESEEYNLYRNDYCSSMILFSDENSCKQGIIDEQKIILMIEDGSINSDSNLIQDRIDEYKATITNTNNEPILSAIAIPYEEGLHIYVDGTEVKKYKAYGFYLGFDLQPGVHNVVIKYRQPYLLIGLVISTVSAFLFILVNCIIKRRS